jgi:hypothetical protein
VDGNPRTDSTRLQRRMCVESTRWIKLQKRGEVSVEVNDVLSGSKSSRLPHSNSEYDKKKFDERFVQNNTEVLLCAESWLLK